jgi:starvation-inducible DNA-binding protein
MVGFEHPHRPRHPGTAARGDRPGAVTVPRRHLHPLPQDPELPWNVTGPMFQTLHLMFEGQYLELALAVDLIAERIRALGAPAPATYHEFATLSSIAEDNDRPDATEMIRRLVAGQEAAVRTAREVFAAADATGDQPTADLLTQRMQVHEKAAWMLRSLLQ